MDAQILLNIRIRQERFKQGACPNVCLQGKVSLKRQQQAQVSQDMRQFIGDGEQAHDRFFQRGLEMQAGKKTARIFVRVKRSQGGHEDHSQATSRSTSEDGASAGKSSATGLSRN